MSNHRIFCVAMLSAAMLASWAHQDSRVAAIERELADCRSAAVRAAPAEFRAEFGCANSSYLMDPIIQEARARRRDADTVMVKFDEPTSNYGITEISFARDPCLGACPAYSVTFRADGEVTYQGYACVEHIGTRRGRIQKWQFDRLAELAMEIGFFELKGMYLKDITDGPSTYFLVSRDNEMKVVTNYAQAGPRRLHAFDVMLERAYQGVTWE